MIARIFPEGHFALLMKIKIMPGGLFELSQTMAYTTRNTVNRLYMLNQIATRDIRMSLDKRIAFSNGKYDTCDKNLPVLASSNHSRARCHDISVHSKYHILSLKSKCLETFKKHILQYK